MLSRYLDNDDSIKDYISSYIPFIGYCFLVIGSLLYNEIIIFYPFGLSVNTKKEVRIRASNDILLYKESVKEISMGITPLIEEKEAEKDENNLFSRYTINIFNISNIFIFQFCSSLSPF